MPEQAMFSSELAESLLVVRAWLLFLGRTYILWSRMSIHAYFLDVTMSVLLEELTYWNSVLYPPMQVLTRLTLSTRLLQPMHTYLLFPLLVINLIVE